MTSSITNIEVLNYVHVHQTCPKCGLCRFECEHRMKTTTTTTDAKCLKYINPNPVFLTHPTKQTLEEDK